VKAAAAVPAGHALAGTGVPASVASLVEGASRTMMLKKCKAVVFLLISAALVGLVGLGALPGQDAQPSKISRTTSTKAARGQAKDTSVENGKVEVLGRVLDPEGKPVGNALVRLAGHSSKTEATTQTTGPDGRFRLSVTPDALERRLSVVATAKGHGPDWILLDPNKKSGQITLRLPKDDVPVTGRILDLEGKPVAGATVAVVTIGKAAMPEPASGARPAAMGKMPANGEGRASTVVRPAPNGLVSWVEQNIKFLARRAYAIEMGLSLLHAPAVPAGLAAPVTTDKDGRFRLSGIGRDRTVVLDVRGPGIERRRIWMVTLAQPPKGLDRVVGLYGPSFEHLAGPAKPALGIVKDKETGKPLAGIRVVAWVPKMGYARGGEIDAVTDHQGRYRLDGLPKSDQYFVTVDTLAGLTYLPQEQTLADTEGLKPLRADFELVRGTLVEGRALDQQTGKPVRGSVTYFPLPGNAQYQPKVDTKMGLAIRASHPVGPHGSFKLLVFPGPGVICASGDIDTYLKATVEKKDMDLGVGSNILFGYQELFAIVNVNGHAYHVIRPAEKPEALKVDLKLGRGRTITGSLSAGGKAAPGVEAAVLRRYGAYDLPVQVAIDKAAGTFTAVGLDPQKRNLMVFYREKDGLAGAAEPRGDEKGPVAVRLHAWGTVRGRVLDENGKPAAGATVKVSLKDSNGTLRELRSGPLSEPAKCGSDGRFQVKGLVPGFHYELSFHLPGGPVSEYLVRRQPIPGGPVKEAQMNDLGDVKIPPPEKVE
jgi:protocatechuate 3,4-dioxygenase beta subunit